MLCYLGEAYLSGRRGSDLGDRGDDRGVSSGHHHSSVARSAAWPHKRLSFNIKGKVDFSDYGGKLGSEPFRGGKHGTMGVRPNSTRHKPENFLKKNNDNITISKKIK